MILTTTRLSLKPHSLHNAKALTVWENDPELLRLNSDQPAPDKPQTVEETRHYLEGLMDPVVETSDHYAIHLRKSDRFIGYGTIAFIDRFNRTAKLSIVIGLREEWRKGLATEALAAVFDYSFRTLELNRLGAEIFLFNTASIALFKKLGFVQEGRLRETIRKDGTFFDELVFGLLKTEWKTAKRGPVP